MAIRKALFVLAIASVALSAPAPIAAQCTAPASLTGKWKGDDGGTYRIRAVGNEVWWIGTSADGGKSWTNVYKGNRVGQQISGRWADIVPANGGNGVMTLTVVNNGLIKKASESGSPFGGTKWGRVVGCDDMGLNPV